MNPEEVNVLVAKVSATTERLYRGEGDILSLFDRLGLLSVTPDEAFQALQFELTILEGEEKEQKKARYHDDGPGYGIGYGSDH